MRTSEYGPPNTSQFKAFLGVGSGLAKIPHNFHVLIIEEPPMYHFFILEDGFE